MANPLELVVKFVTSTAKAVSDFKKVETQVKDTVKEVDKLAKEAKEAGKALDKLGQESKDAAASIDRVGDEIKDTAADAARADDKVKEMATATDRVGDEAQQAAGQIKNMGNQAVVSSGKFSTLSATLKTSGQRMKSMGTGMVSAGRDIAIAGAAGTAAFVGIVKAASDFEEAFLGVEKTVDATEEEFKQLRQNILDMADVMPQTQIEIAGVMEVAGQLGIRGVKDITDFTKTMVMLGETTNLNSEAAAVGLAKIRANMGLTVEDIDRAGSSITSLGNDFAAFENEMMDVAQRIAGTGGIVGLTVDQVFALAAAMKEVGLRSESGGTAMNRLLKDMQKIAATPAGEEMGEIAEMMGLTAEEAKNLITNNPAEAILVLASGFKELAGDEGVGAALKSLDKIGVEGERYQELLLKMANGQHVFRDALDQSRTAFEENTALTEEYDKKTEGLNAQFRLALNNLRRVSIELGTELIPVLVDLLKNYIVPFAQRLKELNASSNGWLATLLLVVGGLSMLALALSPVLILLGTVTSIIGSGLIAWTSLSTAATAAGVSVSALLAPLGLLLLKFALVTGALIAIGLAFLSLKDDIEEYWGIIKLMFNDSSLGKLFGGIWGWVTWLKDKLTGFFDWLSGKISDATGKLRELMGGDNSTFAVPLFDTLSDIGGIAAGAFPFLPRFAEGGIVTRPTVGIIGEGGETEVVLPLSKFDEIFGKRGTGEPIINIYQQPGQSPRELARIMADELRRSRGY